MAPGDDVQRLVICFHVLLVLAVCGFIVAFSSPEWSVLYVFSTYIYAGLWTCKDGVWCSLNVLGNPLATQCLEIVALVADVTSVAALVFSYGVQVLENRFLIYQNLARRLAAVAATVGGVLGVMGAILYSTYTHDNLAWAFVLSVFASVVIMVSGVSLLVLGTRRAKQKIHRSYESL
ncbi:uncharacterized protein LOC131941562 [Physella acuta]|uniref:uncharacterized protein LOC131941562 n=1 Tax=Physella acuta TaxID=109671 RepID=UPI0027DB0D70|nr:uncharacterized protein LOC131941562 [Physella acuta]